MHPVLSLSMRGPDLTAFFFRWTLFLASAPSSMRPKPPPFPPQQCQTRWASTWRVFGAPWASSGPACSPCRLAATRSSSMTTASSTTSERAPTLSGRRKAFIAALACGLEIKDADVQRTRRQGEQFARRWKTAPPSVLNLLIPFSILRWSSFFYMIITLNFHILSNRNPRIITHTYVKNSGALILSRWLLAFLLLCH